MAGVMLWGDLFLAAGTVLYLGAAVAYYREGVYPLAVVETFYAGANVGLIWLANWKGNK